MLDAVTTLLDLAGALLLVAAVAVAVAAVSVPAALAVGGAGLLAASWLIDRLARREKSEAK